MSCADYDDLLARHALEMLGLADQRAVEVHLAACEDCRDKLGRLRELTGILETTDWTAEDRP